MHDVIFLWAQVDQPTGGITLATIGVVGAIIVGIWQRIGTANIKIQAEQRERDMMGCEGRNRDLQRENWLLQERLRECERKAAQWQTRAEYLGWSGTKNSAPKKDPA